MRRGRERRKGLVEGEERREERQEEKEERGGVAEERRGVTYRGQQESICYVTQKQLMGSINHYLIHPVGMIGERMSFDLNTNTTQCMDGG